MNVGATSVALLQQKYDSKEQTSLSPKSGRDKRLRKNVMK